MQAQMIIVKRLRMCRRMMLGIWFALVPVVKAGARAY
jgi:hypothetical protein